MSKEKQRHSNRNAQQDRTGRGKVKFNDRHASKAQQGMDQIAADKLADSQDYNLVWFKPTPTQKDIIMSMCCNDLTAVQGSSGTGKSTTVIWQALQDLKRGMYKKVLFIKTPSEQGDDQIGYLTGDADQKLEAHFFSMRSIFHTFMSKEKLRMEEKHERISFSIPNFVQGMTFDNCLIIIDEMQSISVDTTKLLLERTGEGSRVVCLGDKNQRYSAKRRSDGFSHFVDMITEVNGDGVRETIEPTMGYVEMTAKDNMRSDLSRRIVELYEQD
ncbi:PhoH-like protein [Vibrio phage 1.187.O._10N.286.49.F1]|nr:PhoH-like protein [Vibrio phage 1.187.O._10N.286.49.F1]